jgi:hypothetical protein
VSRPRWALGALALLVLFFFFRRQLLAVTNPIYREAPEI